MSRNAARLGAAAVALGLSLAAPAAVAVADSPGDAVSATSANPTVADGRAGPADSEAARPGRERRAEPNANRVVRALPAEGSSRPGIPAGPVPAPRPTAHRDRAEVPSAASGVHLSPPAAAAGTAGEAAGAPVGDAVAAVPAAAVTAASGAPGSIQSLIEGAFLLVRRTFFNQAPTVTPVQTTGQITGPITGTVGAVDPDGDPITYTVTLDPQFGSVQVAADGSYEYTPGPTFNGIDTFTVAAADSGLHINLLDPLRPAGTLANVMVDQGRPAWVQFDFSYGGWALLWSPEARSALQSAATILSSYFLVDEPVTLTYTVDGEFSPFSGQLASATSEVISSRAGFFPTVVQQKVISGVDVNGTQADGTVTWNFANPWAIGNSASGGYDFESVAMHELMHTFGFISMVGAPGTNTDTTWTSLDSFLATSDGSRVLGGDYRWNTGYDPNLTGGGGGLYFGGPAAVAVFGGPVPLFTPNPWKAGSSVSHLNDLTFAGRSKKLMTARVNSGTGITTLSPLETAIMSDLGYSMAPQSGGSAVLLVGLILFRRRNRK